MFSAIARVMFCVKLFTHVSANNAWDVPWCPRDTHFSWHHVRAFEAPAQKPPYIVLKGLRVALNYHPMIPRDALVSWTTIRLIGDVFPVVSVGFSVPCVMCILRYFFLYFYFTYSFLFYFIQHLICVVRTFYVLRKYSGILYTYTF